MIGKYDFKSYYVSPFYNRQTGEFIRVSINNITKDYLYLEYGDKINKHDVSEIKDLYSIFTIQNY